MPGTRRRARSYRYCMLRRATRPALLRDRVCWIRSPLNVEAMHEAAQALVGEHDFSSFRAVECQSTTAMRHVDAISVKGDGPLVVIEVSANAYLHHMVRNIAGSLLMVGAGERPPGWIAETLAARDRTRAGITAPAERPLPLERAVPEVPPDPRTRPRPALGYDRGALRGVR